jgi:hypothetical protein
MHVTFPGRVPKSSSHELNHRALSNQR